MFGCWCRTVKSIFVCVPPLHPLEGQHFVLFFFICFSLCVSVRTCLYTHLYRACVYKYIYIHRPSVCIYSTWWIRVSAMDAPELIHFPKCLAHFLDSLVCHSIRRRLDVHPFIWWKFWLELFRLSLSLFKLPGLLFESRPTLKREKRKRYYFHCWLLHSWCLKNFSGRERKKEISKTGSFDAPSRNAKGAHASKRTDSTSFADRTDKSLYKQK